MHYESRLALICPRCFMRSDATVVSKRGAITINYDSDNIRISHAVTKGALHPIPRCKHCFNSIHGDYANMEGRYVIICDSRLGEIIQRFTKMGAYTQWSCEGHYEVYGIKKDGFPFCPDFSVPYLLFSPEQPQITDQLYRAAMHLPKNDIITPTLSCYSRETGRRHTYKYTDLTLPDVAMQAQFGVDFDSKTWIAPRDLLRTTFDNVYLNSNGQYPDTVADEIQGKLDTAIDAYHEAMLGMKNTFVDYLYELMNQYEQMYYHKEE